MKRGLRILAVVLGGTLILCAAAAGLAALSNRRVRQQLDRQPDAAQLAPLDKARLEEALHLKQTLGEAIWPGWGAAQIPVLLWNRERSFLVGHPAPPAPWSPVPDDAFRGQAYAHRATGDTQNFAVQIGDRWVASMATKAETDAFLIDMLGEALPAPLKALIPYRALIQPSEVQITSVLHESFHVYQVQVAPERLAAAEAAHRRGQAYWSADEAMHEAWKSESDLLDQALEANSDAQASELVGQFLDQRARRRAEAGLDGTLVDYERQLEWEEGLAKYVELAAWRAAYEAAGYVPVPGMSDDPDFKGYRRWERRWSQERAQMRRQAAQEGETRFYYTGVAQAMLLDLLLPGWKEQALSEGVWLETLLAAAGQ